MANNHLIKASRSLAYILRHHPEKSGIELDKEGWALIAQIEANTATDKIPLTAAMIRKIVEEDDKGRYQLNSLITHVRAVQGHSTSNVAIDYPIEVPPSLLYHGTADKNFDSINKNGLLPGKRQYVHLSDNTATALTVGSRHGQAIVYSVNTERMLADGFVFRIAENGVWLISEVQPKYLHCCILGTAPREVSNVQLDRK